MRILFCSTFILYFLVDASGESNSSSCFDRKWPPLDLFVPVVLSEIIRRRRTDPKYDRKISEFSDFFLRSYSLFWPEHANTTVRVLTDLEKQNTTLFSSFRHLSTAMLPTVRYDFIPQSPWYNGDGQRRQQLSIFWADNWTTPGTEFVAFADSDTAFLTYVDREDLFEDGKPVINGRFGIDQHRPWRDVPITTLTITGHEEPMRCMAYFPVVLRTEHLPLIRSHITKHMGKATFDEAFQSFQGYFSQFNIMCAILWWNEATRSQYTWYAHDMSPSWDGAHNPPPNVGQWADRRIFNMSVFSPKPRVSVHVRWHNSWIEGGKTIYTQPHMFSELLQRGVCDSPPFPKNQSYCHKWQLLGMVSYNSTPTAEKYTGYNKEMHSFEFIDYYETANHSDIMRMHKERLERISTCPGIPAQQSLKF